MNEKTITLSVNNEHINGILHIPDDCLDQRIMVIYLHGWAGYRTGPHDLFVKLARKLSQEGYYGLRFDFRGRGYSHGNKAAISHKTMQEDLERVMEFVKEELFIQHIILLGICSGAKLALYYAKNGGRKVDHVIELSSPVLRYTETAATLEISRAKANLGLYFLKFFRKDTWLKFFGGEIHFLKITDNILKPLLNLTKSIPVIKFHEFLTNFTKGGDFKRRTTIKQEVVRNSEDRSFSNFNGEILLIHGEKDPETTLSLSQISALLKKHKIIFETHIVKGANHSFYSLKWEQEIIGVTSEWLKAVE